MPALAPTREHNASVGDSRRINVNVLDSARWAQHDIRRLRSCVTSGIQRDVQSHLPDGPDVLHDRIVLAPPVCKIVASLAFVNQVFKRFFVSVVVMQVMDGRSRIYTAALTNSFRPISNFRPSLSPVWRAQVRLVLFCTVRQVLPRIPSGVFRQRFTDALGSVVLTVRVVVFPSADYCLPIVHHRPSHPPAACGIEINEGPGVNLITSLAAIVGNLPNSWRNESARRNVFCKVGIIFCHGVQFLASSWVATRLTGSAFFELPFRSHVRTAARQSFIDALPIFQPLLS